LAAAKNELSTLYNIHLNHYLFLMPITMRIAFSILFILFLTLTFLKTVSQKKTCPVQQPLFRVLIWVQAPIRMARLKFKTYQTEDTM